MWKTHRTGNGTDIAEMTKWDKLGRNFSGFIIRDGTGPANVSEMTQREMKFYGLIVRYIFHDGMGQDSLEWKGMSVACMDQLSRS